MNELSENALELWKEAKLLEEYKSIDASHLTPRERRSLSEKGLSFSEDRKGRILATYTSRLRQEDLREKVTGKRNA